MTTYSVQVVTSTLDGTTTERTKTVTGTGTIAEEFWASVKLPAGASDTALILNLLSDPSMLVVYGGTGVSFKLNAGGTDAISADPFAVVADDNDGLDIDRILLSNSDGEEHDVIIVAYEV